MRGDSQIKNVPKSGKSLKLTFEEIKAMKKRKYTQILKEKIREAALD